MPYMRIWSVHTFPFLGSDFWMTTTMVFFIWLSPLIFLNAWALHGCVFFRFLDMLVCYLFLSKRWQPRQQLLSMYVYTSWCGQSLHHIGWMIEIEHDNQFNLLNMKIINDTEDNKFVFISSVSRQSMGHTICTVCTPLVHSSQYDLCI